jgi:Zn-dependent protease
MVAADGRSDERPPASLRHPKGAAATMESMESRPETPAYAADRGLTSERRVDEPGYATGTAGYSPDAGPYAPAYYPPTYEPEPAERQPPWKRILGVLGAVGLVILKFGAKLKAVLLLLPKLKIFTTSASMLVSIGAYALIWGWRFAVGFVLLLLIHEMGHVIQLRREGIEASAPMFIPFLGALIAAKSLGRNAAAEARVGLAGPVVGSIGALLPLGLYALTGDDLFKALAFVGFFLNLFNLLPVLPLDGGRAMGALSPAIWFVGFIALAVLTFVFPNPIMLLVLLFGGLETWRRWKARKTPEAREFHRVRPATRAAIATVYLGLAALLAVGMEATFIERDFDDV